MPSFYVTWTFEPSERPPEAPFEYLLHPNPGRYRTRYGNAVVEAGSRKEAWATVSAFFPHARQDLVEAASGVYLRHYEHAKRQRGVGTVKPEAAPALHAYGRAG
jgi:hypothetical protein